MLNGTFSLLPPTLGLVETKMFQGKKIFFDMMKVFTTVVVGLRYITYFDEDLDGDVNIDVGDLLRPK